MSGRPNLRSALDTPGGKRPYVRRLFATIADRYDLITVLLSCGADARWKKRLSDMTDARPGLRALDLACGTGDIAFAVAARGARVIGLDITLRMVELAREKGTVTFLRNEKKGDCPLFLVGDMLALPFPDGSFDIVTTGYGIRNVPDIDAALVEIRRVLRPDGRFLSLDFNRPRNLVVRWVYLAYLTIVGSTLGWILHRDPDTYRYIPESIKRYPGAEAIVGLLGTLGFRGARFLPVLGGLMAIHEARRR
jgi:ubiquinone/menaquinone biosynthesis methyltransferase